MKIAKLLAGTALALFLFAPTLSAGATPWRRQAGAAAARPVPAQAAAVQLRGLKRPVVVRRDERGIPYIEAESEEDLYFAQGYVTASDRLWQMELLRRTARGELAEVLGRAALEEDKRRRTYGFARTAEHSLTKASPELRAALEAYARGVNAYVATLDDRTTPPEFKILGFRPRPWAPADSVVVGKNFAEALSSSWPTDLARAAFASLPKEKRDALFPVVSPLDVLVVGTDAPVKKSSAPTTGAGTTIEVAEAAEALRALAEIEAASRRSFERVGLYAEDLAASNNWVVSGRRTYSGKPLLANDPHLSASAPSIWYLVHLSAPGLRVAGVTSPGAPGVLIGHNERIAWGVTNLGPDVQDLYRETFDPENPRRYRTPQGWREAELRREEIKVRKGFNSTETETVTHDVTVTRHGPVVFERGGARYSLKWTALDPEVVDFEGFHFINRARDWKTFRDALRRYKGPTQNFVYADVDGHIGYYGAGLIPVRRGADGSTPHDGATDASEWVGFIPFDELPHVFDPPSGIIVTANSRVVGTSYRHHLTHVWASPTRARRIYDLLGSKKKMTAEDFRAVLGDAYTISGRTFVREVSRVAREARLEERNPKWRDTLALFDAWDGVLKPEARAPRLALEMRAQFQQKILAAAVGGELAREYRWPNGVTFFDRLVAERPREWLPEGTASFADLFDAIHREARASLARKFGEDESKWTWGAEFPVRFPHPLAAVPLLGDQFKIEPFPQTGSVGIFATPNVGPTVSMRMIADLADWDRTQQGITLGQSGLPQSPHWKDQLEDWRNVTPRTLPFTQKAVRAAARDTVELRPAP
ncbi:MAG TPA: penicillin acylase family protein [Pyrinomonadaceae bacterium]|nr:penicillin acylase family protein [Pyrinomonadaceae bacterium]